MSLGSAKRYTIFQSTPLTRGETKARHAHFTDHRYFNPLPSHEGRLHPRPAGRLASVISIHSPHTRGDATKKSATWRAQPFQSTPLTRGETRQRQRPKPASRFQSTPLTRGETTVGSASPGARLFQSTPLTRGETLTLQVYSHITVISIHSPHTRGDDGSAGTGTGRLISIHSPHTRGDMNKVFLIGNLTISIHSPHTRGDRSGA